MTAITRIYYARSRRMLELEFDDGSEGALSAEFLRVHSPSAEVRGHASGQEVLQTGKQDVSVSDIKPIGHYAVQLVFDDGHDSGIFTWPYLYELTRNQTLLWQRYIETLDAAGSSRDPSVQVVHIKP